MAVTDLRENTSVIIARCLADESKVQRDKVLAQHDPEQTALARRLMKGMAGRMATQISYAAKAADDRAARNDKPPLTKEQARELRRGLVASIEPEWLRRRVETMVHEIFAVRRAG